MIDNREKSKIQFSLSQKVLALVLVPLVVSSALLLLLATLLRQAEVQANREAHAREMRGQCTIVLDHADNEVKGLINYKLTQDKDYLRAVNDSDKHLGNEIERLEKLVAENVNQREAVQTIKYLADRIKFVASLAANGESISQENLKGIWQAAEQIKIEIRKLNVYESRANTGSSQWEGKFRDQVKQVLLYGSAMNFAVAILLCVIATRTVLKRLLRLSENYKRLGVQAELLPESPGTDEIAQMDSGFHEMARTLAEYVRKEQAMIENAKDIICSLDSERRFLRINKACFEILGYDSSEICQQQVDNFLAETDQEKALQVIEDTISTRGSRQFETFMICKDGSVRVLLWTSHWAEQDHALFCVLHDITELKRLERTKQDFVAMVSHDLRGPLMSVQATLEMLEDSCYGQLNPSGVVAVSSSQRNLIYLLQFVEQILDIEKMESGRFELSRKIQPIQVVIDRAKHLVVDLATKMDIKLEFSSTAETGYIDDDRLVQVLVNLLSNAIKFAPKGSPVFLTVDKKDQFLEIRVSDKGRGVPKGMEGIIFDRFQQVSSADWKEKKGSGLGLAICKLIVEAHDGSIGVESVEGQGSTFWFKVPCTMV